MSQNWDWPEVDLLLETDELKRSLPVNKLLVPATCEVWLLCFRMVKYEWDGLLKLQSKHESSFWVTPVDVMKNFYPEGLGSNYFCKFCFEKPTVMNLLTYEYDQYSSLKLPVHYESSYCVFSKLNERHHVINLIWMGILRFCQPLPFLCVFLIHICH